MHISYKQKQALLCLLLCLVMILSGPMSPITAYASLDDDDYDEADAGIVDDDADLDDEVQEEPEPETTSSSNKYQSQIDEINKKMDSLENEKALLEANLNQTKSEKEREVAKKNSIDQQIYITRTEIELLEERIQVLEERIASKEEDIEEKQGEYDDNYALFLRRMRSMYMQDDVTMLGLVLGAEDFADFLTKSETVNRIVQHDRDLMDNLKVEKAALEGEKASLEEDMVLLEEDKARNEEQKQVLATQQYEAQLRIQDIEELERAYKADLEKNQAMAKQMQTELDAIYRQIEWDKNPYVGGVMQWPLPGYFNITSEYGWRFGGSDYHTGMDISGSGVYGSDIVAANDGTVKVVNTTFVTGRGYGIYVIVDHGGGTTTLYAHCSSIVVSEGQQVKKGQTIAKVGSTGWSTGPHLHFEVRLNGSHTNPKPYVTGS